MGADEERTDPLTLTSWILNQQHIEAPTARGNLTILLNAICVACKFVESAVRKAGLAGLLGMAGSSNVQVTEEEDDPIFIEQHYRGDYCVVFDPLDGSSNIDCGVSIGTIFGIYRRRKDSEGDVQDVLRPGRDMVCAGYCLYGSSCSLVLSLGRAPSCFTLDPSLGEFVLTHKDLKVPTAGSIYAINEGNASLWDEVTARYVHECKFPTDGSKPKSLRYVGSMVADVHRTLLYGGVFIYPGDKKSPKGKLRLLYECFPMAFLMTHAGGGAITGTGAVLDLQPDSIHQRCPIFLGSINDVQRIQALVDSH